MCTTTLPPNDTDRQLIALLDRIAQQDATALKTLYDQTASRLYGVALRVLGKTEWAEDALQDSFLTIWRTATDYRHSLSPPLAWMGLIVRSRSLDLLRRQKAQRVSDTQELDDALADQLPSDAPTPHDLQQTSQQAQALHGCLAQLEVQQRQVVTLAYMRDLSHSEMAAELHLPLGTVKGWIRRGLERLRQCMAQFA
jgi:RNA polymerase sigma-70 factor (ECF subfamily)